MKSKELEDILNYLKDHSNSKAIDIALALGLSKAEINHLLYAEEKRKDSRVIHDKVNYTWSVSYTPEDDTPESLLQDVFGHSDFKNNQKEIIDNVIKGKDTLTLMPTGGGKSICFQLPALMFPYLTVVVSPLISLMKDQVDSLRKKGIKADYISSDRSSAENEDVFTECKFGLLKLLYLSPEALIRELNDNLIGVKFSLFAIDEAHCISIWGHDFRPEYTQLSVLKTKYPKVPIIALTATATEITKKDIRKQLKIENAMEFSYPIDRPNIELQVVRHVDKNEKCALIKRIVDTYGEKSSGIVYCTKRDSTEEVARDLREKYGINAVRYHAGLSRDVREDIQERYMKGDFPVICATIAFGMGIDKPDIRWIVHFNVSQSVENYYQEIGRAGRDGKPAVAMLLYNESDLVTLRYFATKEGEVELKLKKLEYMIEYAKLDNGHREYILSYFDSTTGKFNYVKHREDLSTIRNMVSAGYKAGGFMFVNRRTNEVYDFWYDKKDNIVLCLVLKKNGKFRRLKIGEINKNNLLYSAIERGRFDDIVAAEHMEGKYTLFTLLRKRLDGELETTYHDYYGDATTLEQLFEDYEDETETSDLTDEWDIEAVSNHYCWCMKPEALKLYNEENNMLTQIEEVTNVSDLYEYIKKGREHKVLRVSKMRIYLADIKDGTYRSLRFDRKGNAVK